MEQLPYEFTKLVWRSVVSDSSTLWCVDRFYTEHIQLHPVLGMTVQALKTATTLTEYISDALSCCVRVHATAHGVQLVQYSAEDGLAVRPLWDLDPSVAAAVIGGTSIFGGRGTYSGTIVGVLILTVLATMLTIMQIPEGSRRIVFGLIILGVTAIYVLITEER